MKVENVMKLSPCLLKSTLVAALGGLLFGFNTAVIAGTTHGLTEQFTSHIYPSASPSRLPLSELSSARRLRAFQATDTAGEIASVGLPSFTSSQRSAARSPGVGTHC
jgi:hypothetical protein